MPLQLPSLPPRRQDCQVRGPPQTKQLGRAKELGASASKYLNVLYTSLALDWSTFSNPLRTSKTRDVICSLDSPAAAAYDALCRTRPRVEGSATAAILGRATLRTAKRRKDIATSKTSDDELELFKTRAGKSEGALVLNLRKVNAGRCSR